VKGIILAGGAGTRLAPLTQVVSKQLLPVYDKPMVYYPISTLMQAGIRDMLVIATPIDRPHFERLLGDGSQWGVTLTYATQPRPEGIAQALIIGADFVGDDQVALILGDNIFYGEGLTERLKAAAGRKSGATLFAYEVDDPKRYGVVEIAENGQAVSIEEKPPQPKSSWAVTGLYLYDARATGFAGELTPSAREELEITDLNNIYLSGGELFVEKLGRGFAWFDAGTIESLADTANFVRAIELRQRTKLNCPEEVAYTNGWIDRNAVENAAERYRGSSYADYLLSILD
jgi:glucose-1-phosphate thymidylyltransferase